MELDDSKLKESSNDNRQNITKYDLKLENSKAERDFFALLFLCQVFNQPQFFMEKLKGKDPCEMYKRAKCSINNNGHELQFYDFYEWIHNDLSKTMHDRTLSMKTGLEAKKKVFAPQLGQINFTKPPSGLP